MRRYEKPSMKVERFAASVAVAGCTRATIDTVTTTVYKPQSVTCSIGGQSEVVFTSGTSGCDTKASKYCVGEYTDGKTYFCWYTGSTGGSNNKPSSDQQKLMETVANVSDAQGWHYCQVTGSNVSTDILGLSY